MTVERETISLTVWHVRCPVCKESLGTFGSQDEAEEVNAGHACKSPRNCSACGKTHRACSIGILRRGRGCCSECYTYDTHDTTLDQSAQVLRELREELGL